MTHADPARSPRLGAILAAGADAASFLRAQLTNDVMRLGPDRHFLAGWCDAKGRTVMLARVAEMDDGYLMILPATLIEPVLRRLRMYVLRAKVELADVSGEWRIDGLTGADAPATNRTQTHGERHYLGLPAASDGQPRALVLSPTEAAAPGDTLAVTAASWQLGEIDAGIPAIYPATQGLFVPQMLNLHWLMAVDFDKGCYPGQEVIARLHYRGRLTRRLFRLAWSGPDRPVAGDAIIDDDGQTQGTVVTSAAEQEDRGRLLAVIRIDAVGDALSSGEAALEPLELPYATPAEPA